MYVSYGLLERVTFGNHFFMNHEKVFNNSTKCTAIKRGPSEGSFRSMSAQGNLTAILTRFKCDIQHYRIKKLNFLFQPYKVKTVVPSNSPHRSLKVSMKKFASSIKFD